MLGLLWIKQIIQNNPERLKIAAYIVFGFTIIFCFLGDDHFSGISLVDRRLTNVDRTFRKVFHLPPDYLDRSHPVRYQPRPSPVPSPTPQPTPQPTPKSEIEDPEPLLDNDPSHGYSSDFPERDMASCHYIHGPEAGKHCSDSLENFVDREISSEAEHSNKTFQDYVSYFFRRLYFSFVTASTLGYGDIYPHSWISRTFVIIQIALMFIISL